MLKYQIICPDYDIMKYTHNELAKAGTRLDRHTGNGATRNNTDVTCNNSKVEGLSVFTLHLPRL